jgi:hypothetical protein
MGTWQRKGSEVAEGGDIEIWRAGKLTRSFTYIDERLEELRRLMESD